MHELRTGGFFQLKRASGGIQISALNNTILYGEFESLIKALAKIDNTLASIDKSLDNIEQIVDELYGEFVVTRRIE